MRRTSALNLAGRSWALALSGVPVLRPATALAQAPPGPKQLAAAASEIAKEPTAGYRMLGSIAGYDMQRPLRYRRRARMWKMSHLNRQCAENDHEAADDTSR